MEGVGLEYEKIPKGRGHVYVHDNQLYQRVKTTDDCTLYLKCYLSYCNGSAKLTNDVFSLGRPHLSHQLPTEEIQRLKLIVRCKRKAEEEDTPLRQIFDDVCRQSSQQAAQSVSFASIKSSMYKRRRLSRQALPTAATSPEDVNAATGETCDVCLLQPRSAVALVPCGHSRFCAACADAAAALDSGCPLCRSPIRMALRIQY